MITSAPAGAPATQIAGTQISGTQINAVPPKLARIGGGLILLLGALTAVGPFTIDLYLAAFPQITADMGTQPAAVQLTITATLAGLALGQLLIGSISDAIGRRRPLLAGLSLYVLASMGIVFVTSVEALTALRFVQGFAASAGGYGLFYLRGTRDGEPAGMGYGFVSYRVPKLQTRIEVGGWFVEHEDLRVVQEDPS